MRPFSLGRWVGYVVIGEYTGFLLPLAGFALAWGVGLSPWAGWALQVLLGSARGRSSAWPRHSPCAGPA